MKSKIIFLLAVIAANLQCAEQSQFAQDSDAEMPQVVQVAPTDDLADALLGDEEIKKKAQTENSTKKKLTNNGFLIPGLPDSVVEHALAYRLTSLNDIKNLSKVSKVWSDKLLNESRLSDIVKKVYNSGNKAALQIGTQADLVEIVNACLRKLESIRDSKLEDAKNDLAINKIHEEFKKFRYEALQGFLNIGSNNNSSRIIKSILNMNFPLNLAGPIFGAIRKGHTELAKLLISKDDKFAANRLLGNLNSNDNILHVAVKSGKLNMFNLIRQNLNDLPVAQLNALFQAQNKLGNTVLHEAILSGNQNLIKTICFDNNGISEKMNANNLNVLGLAIMDNNIHVASTIISAMKRKKISKNVLKKILNSEALNLALKKESSNFLILLTSSGATLKIDHFVYVIKSCFDRNNFEMLDIMLANLTPQETQDTINKCFAQFLNFENIEILKILIKKYKADVNYNNCISDYIDRFMKCSEREEVNLEIVKLLIDNGAKVDRLICGKSVLVDACRWLRCVDDELKLLKLLLNNGARALIHQKEEFDRHKAPQHSTPLENVFYYEWSEKSWEIVKLFLGENLSFDKSINDKQETLLHLATGQGNVQAAEFLLKNGAGPAINMSDVDGNTPLLCCAKNSEKMKSENFYQIIDLMAHHNCDINHLNHKGYNLLFCQSEDNCLGTIQQEIEHFIKLGIFINSVDKNGNTLLHHLSNKDQLFLVCDELIKNGIDVKIKNKLGKVALHLLAKGNDGECQDVGPEDGEGSCEYVVLPVLKAAPELVNSQDHDGRTPLHYAIDGGCIDAAEVFLKNGANSSIQDNDGMTPLHLAVLIDNKKQPREYCSSLNKVKLLIQNNCNIHVKNHDGKTAYDLAVERQFDENHEEQAQEHQEIIAMLKSLMN